MWRLSLQCYRNFQKAFRIGYSVQIFTAVKNRVTQTRYSNHKGLKIVQTKEDDVGIVIQKQKCRYLYVIRKPMTFTRCAILHLKKKGHAIGCDTKDNNNSDN